jgi:SAM-dependent methyltransferase
MYDRLFPDDTHAVDFYRVAADRRAEALRKAAARGVEVGWVQGDMRELDLGRTFDLVFIAANSLLHLHAAWSRAPFTAGAALQLCVCERD